MIHDLQWFEERRGREVLILNLHTEEQELITIDADGVDCRRRHLYQDCGYRFRDQDTQPLSL